MTQFCGAGPLACAGPPGPALPTRSRPRPTGGSAAGQGACPTNYVTNHRDGKLVLRGRSAAASRGAPRRQCYSFEMSLPFDAKRFRAYEVEFSVGGDRLGCKFLLDDGSLIFIHESEITPEVEAVMASLGSPTDGLTQGAASPKLHP